LRPIGRRNTPYGVLRLRAGHRDRRAQRGFEVHVIAAGTRAVDPEKGAHVLEVLAAAGAVLDDQDFWAELQLSASRNGRTSPTLTLNVTLQALASSTARAPDDFPHDSWGIAYIVTSSFRPNQYCTCKGWDPFDSKAMRAQSQIPRLRKELTHRCSAGSQ
jgi:hypothetical protein